MIEEMISQSRSFRIENDRSIILRPKNNDSFKGQFLFIIKHKTPRLYHFLYLVFRPQGIQTSISKTVWNNMRKHELNGKPKGPMMYDTLMDEEQTKI